MVLILFLVAIIGYLYLGNKKEVATLTHRISELETLLKKSGDECETKIAIVKKETAQLLARQDGKSTDFPLKNLLGKVALMQRSAEKDTLAEMGQTLNLQTEQANRVEEILNDFKEAKRRLVIQSGKEKQPPFEGSLEDLNAARTKTLRKLQTVLNDEQYRRMIEHHYDRRLGLAIAESPEHKAP